MYAKCMKNLQQQQQKRTVRQCKPCAKAGADLFLCLFLTGTVRQVEKSLFLESALQGLFLFFVLIVQCLGHLSSDIHD